MELCSCRVLSTSALDSESGEHSTLTLTESTLDTSIVPQSRRPRWLETVGEVLLTPRHRREGAIRARLARLAAREGEAAPAVELTPGHHSSAKELGGTYQLA